ncbi:hypothetical protein HD554DRAFT_291960 [Boletus coccyginus]|nr:hypothetical protein HD554DRAFT_291960 [Boletus coccyginus]
MNIWTFPLFLGAADLTMILRVWAIFNRSRTILGTLLTLLSLTIIFAVLATSINDKRVEHFVIDQILDISICEGDPVAHTWISVAAILQITEGVAMSSLVILQFVQQSVHMYRMTKRWEINRYMNLLVKQGALYFLAYVSLLSFPYISSAAMKYRKQTLPSQLMVTFRHSTFCFSLINVLNASGKLPAGGWQKISLYILEIVPMYTLTPRFIMGLKEVYARDVQGRHWSRINTVFGLWLSDHGVDGAAVELTDIERNDGLVGVEESPTATRMSAGTS